METNLQSEFAMEGWLQFRAWMGWHIPSSGGLPAQVYIYIGFAANEQT
jgi:hypothetical protein